MNPYLGLCSLALGDSPWRASIYSLTSPPSGPTILKGLFGIPGIPWTLLSKATGFLSCLHLLGLRHFRGGQLHRNQEGQLVTHTGDVLVGKKGPIKLPPGNMTIEPDGTVRVNNAVVDTLKLEQVPESVNTVKSGDLFWHIPKEAETAEDIRVHQGKIEKSNVKPGVDLMELIKVTRGYEQMQKAIRTMDELTAQVIQTARVQG